MIALPVHGRTLLCNRTYWLWTGRNFRPATLERIGAKWLHFRMGDGAFRLPVANAERDIKGEC